MRLLLAELIAIVAVAVGFTGCETATSGRHTAARRALPENDDPARAAGLVDAEIAGARKLYVSRCARCHKFYDPADYDDAEWNLWMTKMSRKARLKPNQQQLVSRYLEAFRASGRANRETRP